MHKDSNFSSGRQRLNSLSLVFWGYIPNLLEKLYIVSVHHRVSFKTIYEKEKKEKIAGDIKSPNYWKML